MFKPRIKWESEISNITKMFSEFKTMREVGEYYDVSKQRIKQVCSKYSINTSGKKELKKVKTIQFAKKWGTKVASDLYDVQRHKFRAKRSTAKRLGIEWDVDFGDLEWPTHCPILGLEINYFNETTQENSCSFDRVNSELGYVHGNVRIISWRANRIKNNGTAEEHRKIADYIDNNL